MKKEIRLVIVDDDPFITLALQTILQGEEGFCVCATGSCGREAAQLYAAHQPDVLLSDIRMPYEKEADNKPGSPDIPGGLEAAEEILKRDPGACILLLTTFLDDAYIIRALRMGVSGYLLKQDYSNLAAAIRAAAGGQSVFGQEITAKMPGLLAQGEAENKNAGAEQVLSAEAAAGRGLTEREYELCALVADGLSNKEIAERLFLSEGTVRNYLTSVLGKLQLRDRTQLAVFYLRGKA